MIKHQQRSTIMVLSAAFFLSAGMQQITAQEKSHSSTISQNKSDIPEALISDIKYTVIKSVNSVLEFDEATPYFLQLTIVDTHNIAVPNITGTDVTGSDNNIIKRKFNFSDAQPGIYYAKGLLTGAVVFYEITVKN